MIIMVSHGFPSVVEPLVTFHVLFWRAILHSMTCLHSKMDSRYLWRLSSVESPVDHLPPACERHKHLWRHHEANLSQIWNYSACITLSQPYLFLPSHPKNAQRPSWLPNILHTCKVPDSRLHLPVALRGWTRENGTGLDGVSWLFPCLVRPWEILEWIAVIRRLKIEPALPIQRKQLTGGCKCQLIHRCTRGKHEHHEISRVRRTKSHKEIVSCTRLYPALYP